MPNVKPVSCQVDGLGEKLSGSQQLPAGGFAQLVKAIRSGATYVNVHTGASPGGEIRGQIRGEHDKGGNSED